MRVNISRKICCAGYLGGSVDPNMRLAEQRVSAIFGEVNRLRFIHFHNVETRHGDAGPSENGSPASIVELRRISPYACGSAGFMIAARSIHAERQL
ncbi:MAG: hypothetical protein ACRYFW_02885 [Janthinobacterium lividum]